MSYVFFVMCVIISIHAIKVLNKIDGMKRKVESVFLSIWFALSVFVGSLILSGVEFKSLTIYALISVFGLLALVDLLDGLNNARKH